MRDEEEALVRFKEAAKRILTFQDGETFDAWCARASDVLNTSQRAMLAALLDEENRKVQAQRQAKKTAWINAARVIFNPGYRRPCYVFGKFRDIAQAHHVVPLTAQYDRGFNRPDVEHEWLCPNHHLIVHLLIPGEGVTDPLKIGQRASGPIAESSLPEIEKLLELVQRSGRGET